ncbi:unnamed protein product, partial [Caretta caretta]
SLQLDPGKEVVTSRRTGTLRAFPGNRGKLPGLRVASREMYAKRLKSDLVELCRQRGLRIGRSTKEQLIAQLEERDRLDDPIPVPEGSRPADAAWAPGPDRADTVADALLTIFSRDWDKYLPHLLFAYREVPQESTGFSPFELLYGRRVRGPLDLMRDELQKQLNEVNYVVELSNRAHHRRVYHVNMMKPYYARGNVVLAVCGQWEEQGDDPLVDLFPGTRAGSPLETIPLSDQLTPAQQAEVRGVLHPYRQLFSNQPGRTNLTVHRVQTGSHPPIRCSPFRVTGKTAQDLEREVRDMLALGVIQPSASPWLNAITVSDAYPMPRPDELLDKLGGARYLTTMDLTKGYWQVPLDADARLKSAFITPLGLYEFLTLPFGLKGAPDHVSQYVTK